MPHRLQFFNEVIEIYADKKMRDLDKHFCTKRAIDKTIDRQIIGKDNYASDLLLLNQIRQ